MTRLEKLLIPIFLLVAVGALLLQNASVAMVSTIGKIVGIFLVTLFSIALVLRAIMKLRRARQLAEGEDTETEA